VVANDSATLAAALNVHRADGSPVALHISTRLQADLWVVEPRRIKVTAGEVLCLPDGSTARLLVPYAGSQRLWVGQFDADVPSLMATYGRPITYPYVRGRWPLEMYQTVYAGPPGSAEMPSAGRPFSPDVLEQLAHRGVQFAPPMRSSPRNPMVGG
jgi:S-adenosylmethionine:tRNA ribosyltransferase-isomerase